jgi:nucleoside-diphosphate-sugar epimerase
MSSILITGGAGYIGSVLVPALLHRGHAVTVLDRFPHGGLSLAACCKFSTFTPVRGDVRDDVLVRSLMAKAEVIVPLAALVGAPACEADPWTAGSVNRDAVIAIARNLGRGQRLVIPTTNSGYGIGSNAPCTEESPIRPLSIYGATKMEAERAVLDAGGISLRLATAFGVSPRMRIDLLVNDFVYRAVTDRAVIIFEGHFRRNFIHVRDIASAFHHVVDGYGTTVSNGEVYNVGLSDANLTKLELCAKIAQIVPEFVFMESAIGKDPDQRDYIVSNAKIEATGFLSEWSLERGIRELIKGYAMLRVKRFSNWS